MKKITLVLAFLLCLISVQSQTIMSPGDIAFMGSNVDGTTNADDTFVFVLLKDIDAATTIIFTDRGWSNSTGFTNHNGDGEFIWTSGSDRTAGDIITIDMSPLFPAPYGLIGDQLFAIQGSIAAPTFIAGLQFNEIVGGGSDGNWDGEATTNSTSELPTALSTGDTAVRLINALNEEQDNWQFSCALAGGAPIAGSPSQIRAILHNRANWNSDADLVYIPALEVGCSVTVTLPDNTPPTLVSLDPADEATDVPVDTNFTIELNEPIQLGTGNIQLIIGSGGTLVESFNVATSTRVSLSGNSLIIDATNDLDFDNPYYIFVPSGAIQDLAGNDFVGIFSADEWDFTTESAPDNTPPMLSTTNPADNAIDVALEATLTATFSEPVQFATGGEIIIQNVTTGTPFGTVDAASAAISFSGNGFTIDPMAPFLAGNEYEVQIDGTDLEDAAGNPFAGITSGGWTFTVVQEEPVVDCTVVDGARNNDSGKCFYTAIGNEFNATATDNVGVVSFTNNYNNSSSLAGETFPVGTTTVIWMATDADNNMGSCSVDIVITDNEGPTAVVQDVILELNAQGEASNNVFNNGALISRADNCAVAGPIGITGPTTYTCDNLGVNPVTIFIRDINGNETLYNITFTVTDPLSVCVDTDSPLAVCKDITLELDSNGTATVSVTDIDSGSSDNEGIVSYGVQRRVARIYDQNATPDAIFGSGNANGSFTVNQTGSVELDLRAKVRYPSPSNTFNSNGDGTYAHLAGAGSPSSRALWNFEWSINTDPTGTAGDKLGGLTYEMGIDFDASLGTDYYVFDPITQPFADHAIGNNTTANGGGTVATDPSTYAGLLAANNVAQNSWNHDFFNELAGKIFDPTVDGTYDVYLKAFDGSGAMVGETKITVVVGNGGAPGMLPQSIDFTEADLGINLVELIVVDAAGNVAICVSTVTVKAACSVTVDAQPMDATICAGDPLSFNITATSTGALTYQWQVDTGTGFEDLGAPSANSQLNFAFMQIGGNGNQYRVIATSDNGTPNDDKDDCLATSETATLTVNPLPVVAITGNDSYCYNGVGVVLDAGAGHSSYLWSPGGETTQTISVTEGSYTVEVTNEFDCKTQSEAFFVTNNQPLVCNIQQDVLTTDHVTTDGVATVNTTGGTGQFTYLWDNGETTQTATTLTYGMHSVTVTDSNGCVTICQIDIAKELYCWTNLIQNVSVRGGNDGAARVNGNGGYRPFTFQWDDGSTKELNTALMVGTHYVTITDATGATSKCSVTISEPSKGNCNDFTTNIVQQKLTNDHLTTDGVATVYPKGGTGQYTYLWDNGETTQTATTLTYGMHSVTVTDAKGCKSIAQIDIAKELYCWINLYKNVGVHGAKDGAAMVHGNGGYRPHTFLWDDGSTQQLNNNLSAGTHYVTITDATGATSQCSVIISEPNQEVCDGIDNDGDGQIDEGFDKDGDGIADCFDYCDNRIDSDGDGTPDCTDQCDDRIDTDNDGTPDCTDDCDDTIDTDGDGVADCKDDCDDSIDTDGDGTPDCTDQCDDRIDTDGDGIPDCSDSCTLTITGQPEFSESCIAYGDVTSLTVTVEPNNGATVSYQWQQSVNDGTLTPITSTNTNMLANIGFDSSTFMGYIAFSVTAMSDNGTPNDITDDCTVTSAVATLYSLPVVTFQLPSNLQEDDAPVYLNMGSPIGGSYSGNGVGDDFNGRTIFDPAKAGVGVHTVTYTYTNENNCTQVASNQVEVTAIPGIDCSIVILDQPEFSEPCLAYGDVASLTVAVEANNGATVGYQWQQSVNGGAWTPITSATTNMLADIGFDSPTFTGNIAYRAIAVSDNGTPTDGTDDCSVTSAEVSIYMLPEVSLQLPPDFQVDDAPISLNTGSPMGGNYSGNGVGSDPNGRPIFDPAQAGEGSHIITYEYTNDGGCSNTAIQEVTVSMEPVPQEVYISEYQPNPQGTDPNVQIIELKGTSGATFNGWLIVLDGDGTNAGEVDETRQVTGTFDSNGLLEVEIDNIENPSHTIILSELYDVSITDFDTSNDGQLDTTSIVGLGTIYDALGVPDAVADEAYLYGEQLGGADFKYTGAEPQLVFRDSQTKAWYAINDHTVPIAHSVTAVEFAFDQFTGSMVAPTFGAINPLLNSGSITLKLQVWPNPSVKTLNLQLSKTDRIDRYSIHDMTGKMIRTIEANHSLRQQLNVEDLQTGVYMIRASGSNMGTITQKFIKRN